MGKMQYIWIWLHFGPVLSIETLWESIQTNTEQIRTAHLVRETRWELTMRSRISKQKCFKACHEIQEHKEAIKMWRKLEMHTCKMHFLYHAMVPDEKCKLTRLKKCELLKLVHWCWQTNPWVRNKAERRPNVWDRHISAEKIMKWIPII